jgi:hypothetical protein
MDREVFVFGMEKDPSRDPSGTENTRTIICSGGMAKLSYRFQMIKELEWEIPTPGKILDRKKK